MLDFPWAEVEQLKEVTVAQIKSHGQTLIFLMSF